MVADVRLLVARAPQLPLSLLDAKAGQAENAARLATFLRFVFSALVDADRLDTEAFCPAGGARIATNSPALRERGPYRLVLRGAGIEICIGG